jgi:hypothetical protein
MKIRFPQLLGVLIPFTRLAAAQIYTPDPRDWYGGGKSVAVSPAMPTPLESPLTKGDACELAPNPVLSQLQAD